ncbi:MAG: AraC family transcriptional regulator [Myxococcales bacterium]|nr:AraC family transcriptional regulator [Myxococcales bacterium]
MARYRLHHRFAAAVEAVATEEGVHETSVPHTVCVRHGSVTRRFGSRLWRASLAIVARGNKKLALGRARYDLRPGHYTLTPLPLPVTSRIAEAPFACILIGLDPTTLSRVVAEMDERDEAPAAASRGFFTGQLDGGMLEAAVRLSQHFAAEEAGKVLGPGCIRELLFHVLRGPNGPAIRQFIRSGSEAHRIGHAVHRIESDLTEDLDIEALAAAARLGRTAFFAQFKRVTSSSPLQYQKQLRLLEAQRLMLEERTTAEDAAFRVGYQSPSQFSREYAKMFGEPPLRNVTRLRG